MFDAQFASNWLHHLTSLALINIKQEKDESLKAFMDMFDKMALRIRGLSPEVAMRHLINT